MEIKTRQLRAFDAIVRLGSFVEAARALHVTPAALSLSMRELETRLGFAVLERTTRKLHLTEAGRGYLPFVQRVLTDLKDADRYAHEVRQGHAIVRVATTQAVIASLLPDALSAVAERWPRLRVHPLDITTSSIPDALASGLADLAIGVGLPSNDLFETKPFFTSYWYAFVGHSHALANRPSLSWQELAGHSVIMNESSFLKLSSFLRPHVVFNDVQETGTSIAGLAMAVTGSGVAVFPGYVRALASVAGVQVIPIVEPAVQHELQISVPRRSTLAISLHEVCDALIQAVNQGREPRP